MKNILITLLGLLLLNVVSAQENSGVSTQIKPSKYTYCEIIGSAIAANTGSIIDVEFGKNDKYWADSDCMKDENGKDIKFKTMVDALNHMSSLGWELTQAYTVSDESWCIQHWILRIEKDSIPVEK